ncbi:hypothetical protein QFZ82_007793 [Streptomyces sp. V4I23]|nr:hypothetical protein [Streptomyces sp. V4I23]
MPYKRCLPVTLREATPAGGIYNNRLINAGLGFRRPPSLTGSRRPLPTSARTRRLAQPCSTQPAQPLTRPAPPLPSDTAGQRRTTRLRPTTHGLHRAGVSTSWLPEMSLRARTCDPSTEQSSRSSRPARGSSVSRAACRRGHTPASVQSRSRRQAVTPEQPTVSAGTSRHATPVRSTYITPASGTRSGTRSRPGWRRRRSGVGGSSGATRTHRPSGTRSARTPDTLPTKIVEHKTAAQLILKRSVSQGLPMFATLQVDRIKAVAILAARPVQGS